MPTPYEYLPTPSEQSLSEAEVSEYDHSDQYADVVDPIIAQLEAGRHPEEIDGYLGAGVDKRAFLAETPDGPVVVKVIKPSQFEGRIPPNAPAIIRKKTLRAATSLIRAQGQPQFEQLLSANPETGVLVTTLADGKKVADMSSKELIGINRSHLAQLQDTLATMRELGLHPHNAGGIYFDRDKGFNFVDYELNTRNMDGDYLGNLGDISTVETFIYYSLEDFDKIDALLQAKADGDHGITHDMLVTTGMRAMVRAMVMRRARKLQGK